jgi:dTDP-4-amino-4,6-dideoxygalactose transaminase
MDENKLEGLITEKTKAIIPVHYAGVSCEMEIIMYIANKYDIPVIEDNAHGLFGKYKDRYLGTLGTFATQSFHETKNYSCGEGGALLINDESYIERAEIIRDKGTNRTKFFRGNIDKYTWVDIGSSYLPSDMLAAFLYAQLEQRKKIQIKRKKIWEHYKVHLENWAYENDIQLPFIPQYCKQTYHMFYLLMPSIEKRKDLIKYLKERGIIAVFHYLPLHLSKMGRKFGGNKVDCPVTEDASERLVRLPFYTNLSKEEQDYILNELKLFV